MSKLSDLIERLTSYKTTIVGVVTALIAIAVLFGFVGEENKEGVIEGVGNFWEAVIALLATVNGLILVFSKDSDKG